MKRNEFEGLYADDETYEDYINRKLLESVQCKPKEESTMAKYYDYEVEEDRPKESTDWSEVVLAIVYWGSLFGILIYAIIRVVNGG